MAGSAIPREAWQTGAGVGGASQIDALGPLRDVTVMKASLTVVDGALVHDSFKQKVDMQCLEESPEQSQGPSKQCSPLRWTMSGPQTSRHLFRFIPAPRWMVPLALLLFPPTWIPPLISLRSLPLQGVNRPGSRPQLRPRALSQATLHTWSPKPNFPFIWMWRWNLQVDTLPVAPLLVKRLELRI